MMKRLYFYIIAIAFINLSSILIAQESNLKEDIETQLKELRQKVEALEKSKVIEKEKTELERLLNEADDLIQKEKKDEATITRVFRGGQRQLQALNPNISMTGDFFGAISSGEDSLIMNPSDYSNGRNRFYLREVEFHIVAPLDPYTRGKFFLGVPGDGSLEVEEAYMEWLNFTENMTMKIGKFLNQFGILNRWHEHGLPQIDRPRACTNLFGSEGLGGMGLSMNFLLPSLWAHVMNLDMEITTGGDGICFDERFDNLVIVSHLKNYYDLNRNAYLELGFSGAHAYNDASLNYSTTIGAVDLTYKWVPAGRSHYKTVEFRNELFFSKMETSGRALERFGFYSYLTNKLGASFTSGIRYSYSQLPWETKFQYEWDVSPFIEFWQSEFVMMRFQYSHTHRSFDDNDHSVLFQTVWSMGPHKHETY